MIWLLSRKADMTMIHTIDEMRHLLDDLILLRPRIDTIQAVLDAACKIYQAASSSLLIPERGGLGIYSVRSGSDIERTWESKPGSVDVSAKMIFEAQRTIDLSYRRTLRATLLVFSPAAEKDHDSLQNAFHTISVRALRNARIYERLRARIKGISALWKVGTTISSSLDLRYLLNLILSTLRDVLAYDAAGIYILDRDGERLTAATLRGYKSEMEHVARAKIGHGLIGWAAKEGTDLLVEDVENDDRYIPAREETRSEMVALLRRGNRIVGAFNVESNTVNAYTRSDMVLLHALAGQAAIAVDNALLYRDVLEKRRLDAELSLAQDIQRKLLPDKAPRLDGWEMAGLNMPAARVGGDYYDFIWINDDVIGICIADVSGKGVPAGLVMATFRASLLAEVLNEYSIEIIMRKVNQLLIRSTDRGVFVTSVYGTLELKSGLFTYCNAGHVEPIILSADGEPRTLQGSDLILGSFSHANYELRRVRLSVGEILVLYTDGVVEAMGSSGEEFGIDRLIDMIRAHRTDPAIEIRDRIYAEVLNFSADPSLLDDLTAMVIKRTQ